MRHGPYAVRKINAPLFIRKKLCRFLLTQWTQNARDDTSSDVLRIVTNHYLQLKWNLYRGLKVCLSSVFILLYDSWLRMDLQSEMTKDCSETKNTRKSKRAPVLDLWFDFTDLRGVLYIDQASCKKLRFSAHSQYNGFIVQIYLFLGFAVLFTLRKKHICTDKPHC